EKRHPPRTGVAIAERNVFVDDEHGGFGVAARRSFDVASVGRVVPAQYIAPSLCEDFTAALLCRASGRAGVASVACALRMSDDRARLIDDASTRRAQSKAQISVLVVRVECRIESPGAPERIGCDHQAVRRAVVNVALTAITPIARRVAAAVVPSLPVAPD